MSTPDAGRPAARTTLIRGLRMVPEMRVGLGVTIGLGIAATAGRVVVPVAVQQTIDRGIQAPGGVDVSAVAVLAVLGVLAVLLTAAASYAMNYRLYRTSETALAAVRTRTFRHLHDLSLAHQRAQRRGSLVSRVTSDVDQISTFIQSGGILLLISLAQVGLATVLMAVYSWPLTLLVWACVVPLAVALRVFQRRLGHAYAIVRERVGALLGSVAESVVGAPVIRAHAIETRTSQRIDAAVDDYYQAQRRAQVTTVATSSTGEIVAGLATAGVVVAGVLLGVGGQLSAGELTAFLFLVTLFVQPVQVATEVLTQAQNAVAGWHRVLELLDLPPEVADPGPAGRDLPAGALSVVLEGVRFAYPDGPEVLHGIDVRIESGARVAVVGETGSGKTTIATLVARLADPTAGRVLLSGVPLTEVRFASLRSRVVMVPQDGFLFDATVGQNIGYGRPEADVGAVFAACRELGLDGWIRRLPSGLDTPVGERGEALSVGERQLVALARAHLADPDLLVLDEATSAVDPATEVALSRALESATRGRTTITVAHRLSTAEAADLVLVVDAGRLVAVGTHPDVLRSSPVYAHMHAAWRNQGGRTG